MKKLDVFMLKAFLGPFVLTTGVATFILLIQYLLKYFDDLVGKNLGASVFGELLFYFALNMMQNALPLGVLVASLMTFGNLGEHFELTAIKSAGISLLRILRPVFFFVVFVAIGMFYFNNYIIPAANLKAYSLLYDIKQTKPALDIKEGAFYNGIPDYSIKVKEKFPDGKTLKDIIIYDHTEGRGNRIIILADSSLMYTILDDKYLKLELFDGNYFSEETKSGVQVDQLYRTNFKKMDLVFSLSSFDLKRRKEELFQNNRQMKNIKELKHSVDSFKNQIIRQKYLFLTNSKRYFRYHLESKEFLPEDLDLRDSLKNDSITKSFQGKYGKASFFPGYLIDELIASFQDTTETERRDTADSLMMAKPLESDVAFKTLPVKLKDTLKFKNDSIRLRRNTYEELKVSEIDIDTLTWSHMEKYIDGGRNRGGKKRKNIVKGALGDARNVKVNLASAKNRIYRLKRDVNLFTMEKERKYALAVACILMFMIGAPLGAIVKKGGLGVPVIIAIFFFITYYIIGSIGNQQSKEGQLDPYVAAWMADVILLPFGLFFLRQARVDARVFEVEVYILWIIKVRKFVKQKTFDLLTGDNEKGKKSDWGDDDFM